MNCDETEKIIFLYVDNKLARNKKQNFEKHISGCKNCSYELEASIQVIKEYIDLPDAEVSENVKQQIFEKINNMSVEQTSSFKNRLALLIAEIRERLDLIPKFKPSIRISFVAAVILGFALIGINHFQKNSQQKQGDLSKIFERTPFLESTYNLSVEAKSLNLDYKRDNRLDGTHRKIVNLKTKHEEFLNFSVYDVEINNLKKRIKKMKNKNLFRRNSS